MLGLVKQYEKKPKIAVYGLINEKIGGLCSGHYLAIRELCELGHEILFIEMKGWLEAGNLANYPNVKTVEIIPKPSRYFQPFAALLQWSQKKTGLRFKLFEEILKKLTRLNIGRQIGVHLQKESVQTLLTAGFQNYWRIPGVRVLSWTQGPIFGEVSWLVCNPRVSMNHYGFIRYILVVFGYICKGILDWFVLGRSTVVICGSKWAESYWVRFGCKKNKLRLLPYAYGNKVPRHWVQGSDNEKTFLHLGRIVPRKRLELLLQAFADPRLQNYRLTILGTVVFPRALSLIKDLPPNVIYYPQVPFDEVDRFICSHKFLIQVSENENLGSSIMEAMSMGIPVILNRTNGTSDYVPVDSWHFFDKYNVEDLVRSILFADECTRDMSCDFLAMENHRLKFSAEAVGARLSQIICE